MPVGWNSIAVMFVMDDSGECEDVLIYIRGDLEMVGIRSATFMMRHRGHTFKGLTKAMYQYTLYTSGMNIPLPPIYQLLLFCKNFEAGHTLSSTHIVFVEICGSVREQNNCAGY